MPRQRTAINLVEVLVVIVLLVVIAAFLMPSVSTAPEAARRSTCLNNLRQIGLALANYQSVHGTLPPAYTVDDEGNRLHSWRTLILPYMEHQDVFDMIDLSKPWNDPVNAKAREVHIPAYVCPSAYDPNGVAMTTYMAVIGPECAFEGPTPRTPDELKDGAENTIAVTEVNREHAVHWMTPEDIQEVEFFSYFDDPEVHTNHPGVVQVVFVDAHATALNQEIDKHVLRALLTVAGGEKIGEY